VSTEGPAAVAAGRPSGDDRSAASGMDRRIDVAVALCFAAFGLFMMIHATGIKLGMAKDPVGPRAFFYGCGAVMFVGGVFLVAQRLRHWKAYGGRNLIPTEGTADEEGYPASATRAFAVAGASILYALSMPWLGYLLATPLFIMAALAILGHRRWTGMVALAVSFTVVFYVIFAQVLNVRIPVGPLTQLFRDLGWIYL
jgi:putative tricarboxylic transport membrane protein